MIDSRLITGLLPLTDRILPVLIRQRVGSFMIDPRLVAGLLLLANKILDVYFNLIASEFFND